MNSRNKEKKVPASFEVSRGNIEANTRKKTQTQASSRIYRAQSKNDPPALLS
jgi:hypothetical protein